MTNSLDLELQLTHRDLPILPSSLPPLRTGLLRTMRRAAESVFRSRWDITVHNADLVPRRGPVILACNHIGVLDGPMVVALTPRPTFALAKSELFDGAVGVGLSAIGQISINRDYVDTYAQRRAVKVLRSGHALAIFPEGRRHFGDLQQIKGGFAYLAMITGAPIVPVGILGTRLEGQTIKHVPTRGQEIHLVYGEPIPVEQTRWPRTRQMVAAKSSELQEKLIGHLDYARALTGMALPGPAVPVL